MKSVGLKAQNNLKADDFGQALYNKKCSVREAQYPVAELMLIKPKNHAGEILLFQGPELFALLSPLEAFASFDLGSLFFLGIFFSVSCVYFHYFHFSYFHYFHY